MPRLGEIRELKNVSKEDRLLLIQTFSKKNNKEDNKDFYHKLSNNYHCPYCRSNGIGICKNGFPANINNLDVVIINNYKKNYTIRARTIWQNTHEPIGIWQEYIELFSKV